MREAVIVAGIPRRSVIRRSEASVTVTYDGSPRFARSASISPLVRGPERAM